MNAVVKPHSGRAAFAYSLGLMALGGLNVDGRSTGNMKKGKGVLEPSCHGNRRPIPDLQAKHRVHHTYNVVQAAKEKKEGVVLGSHLSIKKTNIVVFVTYLISS